MDSLLGGSYMDSLFVYVLDNQGSSSLVDVNKIEYIRPQYNLKTASKLFLSSGRPVADYSHSVEWWAEFLRGRGNLAELE